MNKFNFFIKKQIKLFFNQSKKQKKRRECVTFIFDPLVESLNSKRGMIHNRLHCSCFILFPSVHTLLFMFHLISISPQFIAHASSHFLQSTLHWLCFTFISFNPQSILFISPTTVHLVHIYLIWLYSYYMVIQLYCQFHFSANSVSGN